MAERGHWSEREEALVAASLFGPCGDTRAARLLKALTEGSGPSGPSTLTPESLLERLASGLWVRPSDRVRRVEEARTRARAAMARARAGRIHWRDALAEQYPCRLREIPDPPIVLWRYGGLGFAELNRPAVAIVGSRRASPSSLAIASELGRELAALGLVVISGLARGVDGAAHQGALEAGGLTVAVLGSGVDVVYPPEHQRLAEQVSGTGALISEFPPGTPPRAHRFPLRNRVISGLSLAVVVIEAHQRSGSLITARAALEQGRDVLAVPGNVASGRHRGGHALIKDGARLVETVDDVLEEIGWTARPTQGARKIDNHQRHSHLGETMVVGEAYTVDDLARATGWSAAEVLAELSALELEDRVVRSGGEYSAKA